MLLTSYPLNPKPECFSTIRAILSLLQVKAWLFDFSHQGESFPDPDCLDISRQWLSEALSVFSQDHTLLKHQLSRDVKAYTKILAK